MSRLAGETISPVAIMRAGFSSYGRGLARYYTHPSGWRVEHCGHPTANWPWAVIDPDGRVHRSGKTCHEGYAFRLLRDAIAHVVAHLRGSL